MLKRTLFFVIGILSSLPVAAVNLGFMKDGPASHFTDQDWEIMQQAKGEALKNGVDGDIEGWSNPDTGAYGTIQPLDTRTTNGRRCRRTTFYNSARGTGSTTRFTLCEMEDGSWRVLN